MPLMQRHKTKPNCPVHNQPLTFCHGRFGGYYACMSVEGCDVSAGKSKHDGHFYLSDQEMRNLKHKAHDAFDKLWSSKLMTRREAYHWLSGVMGTVLNQTHILHFTAEQCQRVVELAEAKLKESHERPNPSPLR